MTSTRNTAITGKSQQLYADCIILYSVRACDVHLCSLILTTTLPCQMSKSPCSRVSLLLQHHSHRNTAASHCKDAQCLVGGGGRFWRGGDSVKPTTETLSWGGRHLHGGGNFVIPVQSLRPETLSWGRLCNVTPAPNLRQVSCWCCVPKIIKISHGDVHKIKKWPSFLETRCTATTTWVSGLY